MDKKNKFSFRKFITLINVFSFFVMVISGLILFFVPQGRIAYWTEWKFLALTKDDWTNVHTASWFLFTIASIFHIYFNWKPLKNYLIEKSKSLLFLKKETIFSIILLFIFVFSGILKIPPTGWIIQLNDSIKNFWAKKPNYDPPFGHAEEVSLKVLAKRMNIDLKLAIEELKKNGIIFDDGNELLKNISKKNKKTPKDIYSMISKFNIEEEKINISEYTPESVDEKFSGTGLGKKTLKIVCEENGIDINFAKEKLNKIGIQMKEEDTFKSIAEKNNTSPIEILKAVLVKDYKIK